MDNNIMLLKATQLNEYRKMLNEEIKKLNAVNIWINFLSEFDYHEHDMNKALKEREQHNIVIDYLNKLIENQEETIMFLYESK